MMHKIIVSIVLFMFFFIPKAQTIDMYFPRFAGKKYDFIIFQGGQNKTVLQGTIPADGRFKLSIPKEYAPYTGMSRWLLMNSEEGGGLTILISGKNFSIHSTAAKPDASNIVYTGDTDNKKLNSLYRRQDQILKRYEAMLQAKNAFKATDKNYPVFMEEFSDQKKAYDIFQDSLIQKNDAASQFTQLFNITRGIGTRLFEKEEDRMDHMTNYIANDLNWQSLYTSGIWNTIINSWLEIHTEVLKNPARFTADFQKITENISSAKLYTDLARDIANNLSQKGNDDYIGIIAPTVVASGKVTTYEGVLASYVKGTVGAVAPELVVEKNEGGKTEKRTISLKTSGKDFQKTLLVFYKSEDSESNELLEKLSANYEKLKTGGVRIIALSADTDEKVFRNKIQDFPWKDTYCDYKGAEGVNFKNYGITGAPTIILADTDGKIISRGASLSF